MKTLSDWKEEMMEEVEGTVISCLGKSVYQGTNFPSFNEHEAFEQRKYYRIITRAEPEWQSNSKPTEE